MLVPSGNDLLLAIDGNLDGNGATARRPLLPGHAWSGNGYHCRNRQSAITCWRGAHGFRIGNRLTVF